MKKSIKQTKKTNQPIINLENPKFDSTREGFGRALVEVGRGNKRVVVLTGDLTESTKVDGFAKLFPERFIQCGVAEQNMMGIGAGLALSGKIAFVSSYAVFNPGRNWDQLRVSVCYSGANVKIIGGHTGLATGPDGATHQALEDIAISRVLPNLMVVVPCDAIQAYLATQAIANHKGPVYMRLTRPKTPLLTTKKIPFVLGKAQILREGKHVTLISCGPILYNALLAAEELSKKKIQVEVINLHTIKPIDADTIINSAKKTKFVVTIEDHQKNGGMGSAVTELLSEKHPVKIIRMGVGDTFAESGTPEELYQKYGLGVENIIKTIDSHQKLKNN